MAAQRGQQNGRVQVLAPSDLSGTRRRRGRLRVGGRVLSLGGSKSLLLADAFGKLRVDFLSAHGAGPGDLLEVAGSYDGHALGAAELLERLPQPESTGQSEFARFSWRGVGNRLRARAAALDSVRHYFAAEGFVEVCTPARVPAPGLDANVHAVRSGRDWLITSPEHHMKRLLVGGLPRIFQIARCFRADESGPLHEPEFSMLEWYRAFSDQHQMMRDTEQLVLSVVTRLVGAPRVKARGRSLDVTPPYPCLTVRAAFQKYAGVTDAVALAEKDEPRFFELWVERVEPGLARRKKPVFLVDFPLCQAALARRAVHDPSVAERFELYLGGVELCNGFTELTDAREQRRRFVVERRARRASGQPVYPLDERFLAALAEGMPPSGGNALGLERLVMLALGVSSLAEVVAFPAALR